MNLKKQLKSLTTKRNIRILVVGLILIGVMVLFYSLKPKPIKTPETLTKQDKEILKEIQEKEPQYTKGANGIISAGGCAFIFTLPRGWKMYETYENNQTTQLIPQEEMARSASVRIYATELMQIEEKPLDEVIKEDIETIKSLYSDLVVKDLPTIIIKNIRDKKNDRKAILKSLISESQGKFETVGYIECKEMVGLNGIIKIGLMAKDEDKYKNNQEVFNSFINSLE